MGNTKPVDQQMLLLIIQLKEAGTIRFNQEFCDELGIPKTYLDQVRNRGRSFTAEHIAAACRAYNVNANWILGIEDAVFRTSNPRPARISALV